MQLVATLVFYVHSTLCVAYAFFLAGKVSALGPAGGTGLLDWRDLDGADEWFVQVSGALIVGLYLVFTEVYLYRMHLGL
ncbi:MAG: hypothetical protein HY303_16040 [Candidatus Wallbacteria bacterium]|nr:hypothetical protein [Candidatus Wallbacteria bacterium]